MSARWPALSAQARSFDDDQFLANNPLVRNPSWASGGRFFAEILEPSTVEGYYLPLSMTSLMLDYALGGRPDNLRQFHRTNLVLHLLNTVLLAVLLYRLFAQPWVAALAVLLFGVHPLTVEPVVWIGERKTLLAAFFALWCVNLYVWSARGPGWKLRLAALLMYVFAVLSKPTAMLVPVILLLLDYWPLRRLKRRSVLAAVPFFVIGAVFAAVTMASHSRTAGVVGPGELQAARVVLTVCYLIVFYLHKMVWPTNLTSVYSLPEPISLSNPVVLAGLIGTSLLVLGLVLSLRKTRVFVIGALVFLVAVLPTLGLVRYSWISASDKYVYLPAIGALLILARCMGWLWDDWPRFVRPVARRGALIGLVLLVAAAETRGTRRYLHHWQDTEGLFRYMISLAPQAHMPHYNLAHALHFQGRLDEAAGEYRTVLRLNPSHADSHNNLGLILRKQVLIDEAISHCLESLRINPRQVSAMTNLGTALGDQGKYDQAIAQYKQALTVTPNDPRVHNALGAALYQQQKPHEAISAYRQALRIDARHLAAYRNLGLALLAVGDTQEAVQSYQEALRLDPADPHAHNNLGFALRALGRPDEAIKAYRQALRLRPDYFEAHRNLGSTLGSLGRYDLAASEFRAALRVDPSHAPTHNQFGDMMFEQGLYDEAAGAYRAALRCKPDYLDAQRNLGVTLACLGRLDEAIAAYREALRLNPNDPSLHNNLGAALLDQGRTDEAVAEFRVAVRLRADYAAALFNLGRALAAQGRTDEAVEQFQRVLQINPADTDAHRQLDAVLRERDEHPRGE